MKNNCVDSCKFINYSGKTTCSKNPDGYQQFYNDNGKKIPYVDGFPEMECFEKSNLAKAYESLIDKLNKLDDLIDKRNEV